MITVNIVTQRSEYVANVTNVMDLLGPGHVTLTEGVCTVKRATVLHVNTIDDKVQLNKYQENGAYEYPLYLNKDSIIEVRVLDEKGPFYKYYLETISSIKIVGRVPQQ